MFKNLVQCFVIMAVRAAQLTGTLPPSELSKNEYV